jgi:hypothetical protein
VTEATNQPPPPPVSPPAAPPPTAPPPPSLAHRVAGLDPATRRQTFIVAAVLGTLFFGTQILNEALPAAADATTIEVAPGNPVAIGSGWQITPLDGWAASPHDSGTGIRLEKGVVVVDLFPQEFESAGDLAQAYLDQALKANATQLTATDIETATANNGSAARFTYQGLFPESDGAIEGEVTAIVVSGQGVVADAWAAQGDLGGQIGEVHQMLDTIQVAP